MNLGTNGWFAAPVLIKCVNDTDPKVAEAATWALTDLKLPPETVIPPIKLAVLDPRWNVRYVAVQALGRLGAQGLRCTELLTNCLTDPDQRVGEAATNALNRIAEAASTSSDREGPR
jgi:HEAT repeat protein